MNVRKEELPKREQILLVHAPIDEGRLVGKRLEERGFRVRCEEHGWKAFNYAVHLQPDLICFDFRMPDVHAAELYSALSHDPRTRGIPKVILNPDGIKAVEKAGIGGYGPTMLGGRFDPDNVAAHLTRVFNNVHAMSWPEALDAC